VVGEAEISTEFGASHIGRVEGLDRLLASEQAARDQ
jgi:hypothetical protein